MFGSRIFLKLYAGFALVIILSSLVVWLLVAGRVEGRTVDELRGMLKARAEMLREMGVSFEPGDRRAEQESLFRRLSERTETRFTLIRADGAVIADSWEAPERMDNHKGRPEVVEAHRTLSPATSMRYSKTIKRELMYLALPVIEGGEIVGVVRTAISLSLVERRLDTVRENITIGAAAAAFIALVLGLFLTRHFLRPLSEISSAAESIARGDLDARPAVASRDEFGQVASSIRRMSDQLHERMDSLTHERNQLRAILGSMLEGVIALDRDERIVHINGMAAALLRVRASECIGKRIWEVVRIQDLSDTLSEVMADGAEQTREVRLSKALRERVIELHAAPLKGTRDTVVGAVLVLHDVTELRHLEVVRREFVANVSHELKTPLTAIRGFVETLIDQEDVDEETRKRFLGRVKDQAVRLSVLVSDLLILSRVESEEGVLELRPIDLRSPLMEASRRVEPEVTGRSIEFEMELPEEPVPVQGDEEGLRQVVDNLLDNAFKYTADGGSVSLRLRTEGGEAVVEVRDTGMGIEKRHADRIFERFYRVDKARSRAVGGTGLGLSIVKHLVEAHDGVVAVESEAGRGSTFTVRLALRGRNRES